MEAFLDKDKKVDSLKFGDTATELTIDLYDNGKTIVPTLELLDLDNYSQAFPIEVVWGGYSTHIDALAHPGSITFKLPETLYESLSQPHTRFTTVVLGLHLKVNGETIDDLKINLMSSLDKLTSINESDKVTNEHEPAISNPTGDKKTAYDSVDSLFDETGYDN